MAWLSMDEYRSKDPSFTDLLPWAYLAGPGLIINKDGSFTKIITYRGPDLDSSSAAQLIASRGQVNNALRRLGSGWCIHIEAVRRQAPEYPRSKFPDPITQAIDDERRADFSDPNRPAYESDFYITFTYLPPEETVGKAEAAMLENARRKDGESNYRTELKRFTNIIDSFTAILEGFMPMVRALDDSETLSYLHNCITDRPGLRLAVPEIPFGLDALLHDTPLVGGLEPILGSHHLRTIGINAFPGRTTVGLLDALNTLPFSYRWVTRYIPLDKQHAEKSIRTIQTQWFQKRKSMATLVKEGISNQESRLENGDAMNKSNEAGAALEVLGADLCSFGYFTATITISDSDLETLDWKRRSIQQILDQQGLVSMQETTNAIEAWLSSLPAHAYANCRRPLISSLNVVDLMPFSAVWAGPQRNQHLKGPALLVAKTKGSTPFRLSLHQEDVGHTMIIGPTGSGKSVLLNTIAVQFLRYENAQVFIFDKGGSARASTLLVGGQYYPIGDEAKRITLQPLADIDREDERIWAADWIAGIVARQKIDLYPEHKTELWNALTNLAARPREQRTLTIFKSLVQYSAIKNAVQQFTIDGPHGALLDATETMFDTAAWQCFEMEELYNRPDAIGPTLAFIFHRLEARFNGRPTILILDEAWLFLDDPVFAGKIREWLKTIRRRNVSVIFASQSLADVQNSPIAPALIENSPTRILLPNNNALEPQTALLYERFGLSYEQMKIISQATKKREYYIQTASGNRLFELGLSRFALTVVGSSSKNDLNLIDELIATYGDDQFRDRFLIAKNFDPATFADRTSPFRPREPRHANV